MAYSTAYIITPPAWVFFGVESWRTAHSLMRDTAGTLLWAQMSPSFELVFEQNISTKQHFHMLIKTSKRQEDSPCKNYINT